jgi:hypothetical protein
MDGPAPTRTLISFQPCLLATVFGSPRRVGGGNPALLEKIQHLFLPCCFSSTTGTRDGPEEYSIIPVLLPTRHCQRLANTRSPQNPQIWLDWEIFPITRDEELRLQSININRTESWWWVPGRILHSKGLSLVLCVGFDPRQLRL